MLQSHEFFNPVRCLTLIPFRHSHKLHLPNLLHPSKPVLHWHIIIRFLNHPYLHQK
jgi:hypothetical protein